MAALHEEPAEVAAVQPDPDAGTPPPPTVPPAAPPAAAPAATAEGEVAGGGGDAAPPKSAAPGPAASPAALDRQTLVAVLQFLRRSNLRESEEILRREARLLGDDLGAAALSPASAGLLAGSGSDADSGEALLGRGTGAAAVAIGGNVATVATSSPGVAAVPAVPPGKGEARRDGGVSPSSRREAGKRRARVLLAASGALRYGTQGRYQVPPRVYPGLAGDPWMSHFPVQSVEKPVSPGSRDQGQGVSRICREHCEASSAPACLCVPLQLVVVGIVPGLAAGMRKEV